MIVFCCGGSRKTRNPPAASSFPTRCRRSRWRATWSPSAQARPRRRQAKLHPLDVKAGDRVLFGKWSGTEVKVDGEELLIMKESDIMGIIEESKPKSEGPQGGLTVGHVEEI